MYDCVKLVVMLVLLAREKRELSKRLKRKLQRERNKVESVVCSSLFECIRGMMLL